MEERSNGDDVVIDYRGIEIPFTGRFKEAVFGQNVIKFYFPENFTGSIQEWLDPDNEFNMNNYGYRGPDFSSNVELLTAGCSVTYGIGVPETGTWSYLLAQKMGVSYAKLAKPGASIEWVVDQLFRYFHEFGNPKYVAVLFPDMFRGEAAINTEINVSRDIELKDFLNQGADAEYRKGLISHLTFHPDLSDRPRLAKKPFPIEDTTAPEETIYKSIRAIRKLEQYCSQTNIQLIWSSWSGDVREMGRTIQPEYKFKYFEYLWGMSGWMSNFMEQLPKTAEDPEGIKDIKLDHAEYSREKYGCEATRETQDTCVCFEYCHEDLREKFEDCFYLGTDRRVRGLGDAHMGVHKHAHVADDFYGGLNGR